jgi:hypothetical protein
VVHGPQPFLADTRLYLSDTIKIKVVIDFCEVESISTPNPCFQLLSVIYVSYHLFLRNQHGAKERKIAMMIMMMDWGKFGMILLLLLRLFLPPKKIF